MHPDPSNRSFTKISLPYDMELRFLVSFHNSIKACLFKQLLRKDKVDLNALQEIKSGTTSIPGFETVVFLN